MNFLAYKRHSAFSVSDFTDPSDHFVGDDGAYYLFTDLATLWQESTRTTQSAATDPVGYADDLSGNGNDALQATSTARFTAQTDGVSLDLVDDLLQITVPVGGWVGTMVIGTDIGCFSASIDMAVGTYNLGGAYFPMLSSSRLIGVEIIDRALTAPEIAESIAFFVTEGATESYITHTGIVEQFFKGHTELTTLDNFVVGSGVSDVQLIFQDCTNLTSISSSDSWVVSGAQGNKDWNNAFRDTSALTSFDMSSWTFAPTGAQQSVFRGAGLTSVDLTSWDVSGMTSLLSAFQDCASLSSFTHGSIFSATSCVDYNATWSGCALDATSVNSILVDIEAAGTSSGTLGMGGGTSAAPTGAGATAKSDLQGRGWTVTTN